MTIIIKWILYTFSSAVQGQLTNCSHSGRRDYIRGQTAWRRCHHHNIIISHGVYKLLLSHISRVFWILANRIISKQCIVYRCDDIIIYCVTIRHNNRTTIMMPVQRWVKISYNIITASFARSVVYLLQMAEKCSIHITTNNA